MTQAQNEFINEVRIRVQQLGFTGSAFPIEDDPKGEVFMHMSCIAIDYDLQLLKRNGMIIIKKRRPGSSSKN